MPLVGATAPSGGVVESGTAVISQGESTTQINQSSQAAVIGWEQFNVGTGESVNFAVPGSSSVTLNKIYDQMPSQILGQVTSNGRVILANPNGLFFGANSQLNVGALIGTTSDVSLMGDRLTLHGSKSGVGIEQQGNVGATGSVAYYSPHVNIGGTINSGADIHVSNQTQGIITLTESGIGFELSDSPDQALTHQGIQVSGELRSNGGYIGLETNAIDSLYDNALNVEGLLSADSMNDVGGLIELTATAGTTRVAGVVSANSASSIGGEVRLAGDTVALVDGGTITADGALGGGEVFIGGGWDYASGPDLARKTELGVDTTVSADGTENGDGGDIWIWSDEQSTVKGALSATGAGQDGNGGFVETSSLNQLIVEMSPEVGSEFGLGGEWLLDPQYIIIQSTNVASSNGYTDSCASDTYLCGYEFFTTKFDGGTGEFTPMADDVTSRIWVDFLIDLLEDGNDITLRTTEISPNSYIWLNAPLDLNTNATGTLTLDTSGVVYIYEDITASTGFSLSLQAESYVYLGASFSNLSEITLGSLNIQSPTVYQYKELSISADSVVMEDGLSWRFSQNLSFDNASDISSSQPDGSLDFIPSGARTLTVGNIGQSADGLGTLNLEGANTILVINGTDILVESLNLNSGSTYITSNDALSVSAAEVTTSGAVYWMANDALSISNANTTSVIQNSYAMTMNMGGNNLTFDNVADLSGSNGSLSLEDVNVMTIQGSELQQFELSINADTVVSTKALSLNVPTIDLAYGLDWTASGDLLFSEQSEIDSLAVNPVSDGAISFDLTGNSLTLGSVGQGIEGVEAFSVDNVDVLTLTDSILVSGAGTLDLGSDRVENIRLNADSGLSTQGGDIRLTSLSSGGNDPVTGAAPTLSVSSGAGDIYLDRISGIGSMSFGNTGTLTLTDSITSVGDSIQIDSGQLYIDNADTPVVVTAGSNVNVNAPIDSAVGITSDLTLQAGDRIEVDDIGASNPIGSLVMATNGTVALNGNVLSVDTLSVDAANLTLTADTTMTMSGATADFNLTNITASSGQSLVVDAPDANVTFSDVSVGALTVNAAGAVLRDSIVTSGTGIDFSQVDALSLIADTRLNAGLDGDILLPDDVEGDFGLTLSIGQGDLWLGSQADAATQLNRLTVTDSAAQFGLNSTTGGVSVTNLLDISNLGALVVSDDALLSSESGDVLVSGTSLLADGQSLTVSAAAGDVSLSDVVADRFTLVSSAAALDGDINSNTQLDLSQAVAIQLENDVTLTGPLQLNNGGVFTSINGNYQLTVDAQGKNLTLYNMGDVIALDSLEVINAATLQLAGGITTQGSDGISFSGSRLDLGADTDLNTSSSDGRIDLSGIGVNGEFTLILNSGNGNIALGHIGQNQTLASLIIENVAQLSLAGDIKTADTLLDLTNAQSIMLAGDVSIDTEDGSGTINLGDVGIDGTFDLSLSTGAGSVQLANVGQSVALQSLSVSTQADMTINRNVSVIDQLAITANNLTVDGVITSFGGAIYVNSINDISMSKTTQFQAFDDLSLASSTGNINLGEIVSTAGDIEVAARLGSIFNTQEDFVSVDNTSVNLAANNVSLLAGQKIGLNSANPIVLDVPQRGEIEISLADPTAYIVNLNQASVTSNAQVFDVVSGTQSAALGAYANAELSSELNPWSTELITPDESSELFAIMQPGYILASNVVLENNQVSSDLPSVPNIQQQADGWWLLYTRQAQP